jgi:hypothetical protein
VKKHRCNWTDGAYPDVGIFEGAVGTTNLFEASNPRLDEVLSDTKATHGQSIIVFKLEDREGMHIPSLHVGLSVFLRLWVVEFERPQTGTSHKKERDILNLLDILFVLVLRQMSAWVLARVSNRWHLEDLQDVQVAND